VAVLYSWLTHPEKKTTIIAIYNDNDTFIQDKCIPKNRQRQI